MTIKLIQMDLYCGKKNLVKDYDLHERDIKKSTLKIAEDLQKENFLNVGFNSKIVRQGPCLLTDKCSLVLQVERNLEEYHNGINIYNKLLKYFKIVI